MGGLSRRAVVGGVGATAVALAGCLGRDDNSDSDVSNESELGNETESTAVEGDLDGTVLGELHVENLDTTSHTIDVIVEVDGSTEQWTTHELSAEDGVSIEREWPDEPGELRVVARLGQEETIEITPAEWGDPNCLNLLVLVSRDGDFEVWRDTTSGTCGGEETARTKTGLAGSVSARV